MCWLCGGLGLGALGLCALGCCCKDKNQCCCNKQCPPHVPKHQCYQNYGYSNNNQQQNYGYYGNYHNYQQQQPPQIC